MAQAAPLQSQNAISMLEDSLVPVPGQALFQEAATRAGAGQSSASEEHPGEDGSTSHHEAAPSSKKTRTTEASLDERLAAARAVVARGRLELAELDVKFAQEVSEIRAAREMREKVEEDHGAKPKL